MVGMAVAWLVAPFPYSDPRVVFAITPVLLVLCGLMIGLAVIFRVPAWGGLGWDLSALWIVVPTGLLLGKLIVVLAQRGASPLLIAQIFLGTLLVGVGEELAFRGIALTSLTRHYSPLVAVLGSAALFGLMHSVNILARQSVAEVAIQVVLTTAFGIAFGWVYLNTGRNLLIVVACHALWDFGGIAAGAAHQGFAAAALAAELIIWTGAVVLSVRGSRRPVSPPSPRTRPTADPSRASSAPRRASRTRPRPTGGET
jgi:membrane protease YdiL (CAAX protease family)